MNEVFKNEILKANYFALFIAITKNKTAKESLIALGISPERTAEER